MTYQGLWMAHVRVRNGPKCRRPGLTADTSKSKKLQQKTYLRNKKGETGDLLQTRHLNIQRVNYLFNQYSSTIVNWQSEPDVTVMAGTYQTWKQNKTRVKKTELQSNDQNLHGQYADHPPVVCFHFPSPRLCHIKILIFLGLELVKYSCLQNTWI